MKREDDQELWDLLGRSGEPGLSPFFARNVLREIRPQPSWRDHLAHLFAPRRLVPLAGVVAVVLAAAVLWQQPGDSAMSAEDMPEGVAQLDEVDYEVVADLDDLVALEEDALWAEGEISTL